jgi:hypothetical protein
VTALATWLASQAASRIVLVDLEPSEALVGWASEGSGAYSVSWSSYTHQQTVPPVIGIYRELLYVRENATNLTLQASVAAVKAATSSYYYDTATSTLYVKTSGGVNPDTVSLVEANFRVRVSSEPVNFSDQPPYDAQIDGSQLPSLELSRPSPLVGITNLTSGSLSLVNASGFWDIPSVAWLWTNRTVTVRIGGGAMAFSDYQTVAVLQLARPPAAKNDVCVFQVRARSNALTRSFPQNTYSDWYGSVPSDSTLHGQYMPMWWGTVYDAPLTPLTVLAITGAGGRTRCNAIDPLQIGSGATGISFLEIRAYPKVGGAPVVVTDYIYGASNYEVDLDASLSEDDYEFRADMAIINVITSGARYRTYGQIAPQVLAFCGVPSTAIDAAAFAALVATQPLGLYVAGGATSDPSVLVSGADLLDLIGRSVLGAVLVGVDGLWTARIFDPSFDWANLTTLDETSLFQFSVVDAIGEPQISESRVSYRPQIGAGTAAELTSSSTRAEAALSGANTLPVETALVDEADATVLAARLVLIGQAQPLELEVLTPPDLMAALPGDKYRLRRTRGPSLTGVLDLVVEVVSASKRLADMTVDAVLGNQQGLGELVKRPAPNGTSAWSGASADEKRAYAFAADTTTERVDTGDPTTFHQAIAW